MIGQAVVGDERPYRSASRYYRARPAYSLELRPRLAALFRWHGAGRLLDVGCGPGVVALELAPCFRDVVGLDPEEAMLDEARKLTPAARVPKVRWQRGRAEDLPQLGLGSFDTVTFAHSFRRTRRDVVAEIVYDLLEPGGAMLLIHHLAARGLEPATPAPPGGPAHPLVPHELVRDVLTRYVPPPAGPSGSPAESNEAVLERTRFGRPERMLLPGRANLVRTVDEVIDAYLGTASASPERIGERLDHFRAELSAELRRHTATGMFWYWPGDTEVLIARKRP